MGKKILLYRDTSLIIEGYKPFYRYYIHVDAKETYTLTTDKNDSIECKFWELHQMIKKELEENPKFGGTGLFFE